jgi:predicted HD superfamily hydrolase involved in NAD metabolism
VAVTYEQARGLLAQHLSPGALEHSERVASTAVSLAALYGVDEAEASLAGLLHDRHRETPPEELVELARERGIPVTDVDEAVPYLLHGPVAASILADELPGLPQSVLEAIRAHTYGSPAMSALVMIVYIADVIEPSRRHEGVDALREAAGVQPLEDLFAETYARALHHLVDTRRRIHPQTVSTWNSIVSGAQA